MPSPVLTTTPMVFTLVASGECNVVPKVIDWNDSTLALSPSSAQVYRPNVRAPLDVSAGLPLPRGLAYRFATHPLVLAVERPGPHMAKAETAVLLGYYLYSPTTQSFSKLPASWEFPEPAIFGDYPTALPVETGTVIVTFTYNDRASRDPSFLVPAGNGSAAAFLAPNGQLTPIQPWPNVLFGNLLSTPKTLWALTIRPFVSGHFVLRMPLEGPIKLYPIPGTQSCRGADRLYYPAHLREETATDDSIVVELDEGACIRRPATGALRLTTPSGRWQSVPTPATTNTAQERSAQIGNTTITLLADEVFLTRGGTTQHVPLEPTLTLEPKAGGVAVATPRHRTLVTTAGAKEIWIHTQSEAGCSLHRYWAH